MTHKFARNLVLAACGAAMTLLPASADTLNQYLPGGPDASFTDGDKTIVFESFSDTVTCTDSVTNMSVACANGSVAGNSASDYTVLPSSTNSVTGLDLPGFTLQGNVEVKSFVDGAGNWVDVTQDISLIYSVTATAGLISDLHLGVGGANVIPTTTVGPPSILITESTNVPGAGSLSVLDPPPTFTASLDLPKPYGTTMTVTKDIDLDSGVGSTGNPISLAGYSVLEQSFSEVPEPRAYAAVLGLFFAALFVVKRRRQQTA